MHSTNHDFGNATEDEISMLKSMLTIDNQLYDHALTVFFKRISNVEKVTII